MEKDEEPASIRSCAILRPQQHLNKKSGPSNLRPLPVRAIQSVKSEGECVGQLEETMIGDTCTANRPVGLGVNRDEFITHVDVSNVELNPPHNVLRQFPLISRPEIDVDFGRTVKRMLDVELSDAVDRDDRKANGDLVLPADAAADADTFQGARFEIVVGDGIP